MSRRFPVGVERTPAAGVGVPWESPVVHVVVLTMAVAPMGVPLVSPALPAMGEAFGLGDARTSLVVSVFFLVGIVLSPLIGLLADRVGRKRVLVVSLVGFGLSGGAVALAPSFPVVLGLRLLQGAATAGLAITTVTLVGDTFEGPRRVAVLGLSIAVLSAGAAVYPFVGGVLVGAGWNVPFVAFLAALPLAVYAAVVLPEQRPADGVRGLAYLRRAAAALRPRPALVLYGTAFVTEAALFGAVYTTFPFLLGLSYGLSAVLVGLAIGSVEVAAMVASALSGRLARRLSNYQLLLVGYACYAVGLVGAGLVPSPVPVVAGGVVLGLGVGLSMPAVDAAVSDLVPTGVRSGALSLRNSTSFTGRATGPVLFTGVATGLGLGYPTTLLLAGVGTAACALLVVALAVQGPDGGRGL